jgi:hypothetical protein
MTAVAERLVSGMFAGAPRDGFSGVNLNFDGGEFRSAM